VESATTVWGRDDAGGALSSALSNDVLIRMRTIRVDPGGERATSRPRVNGGYHAGEQFDVELWVRDGTAGSRGLTAVFMNLMFHTAQVSVDGIDHGSTFTTFASGEIGARSITGLGGATMDQGVAVAAWAHVATVRMTALQNLPRGPALDVRPVYDGVAGVGRGTIPGDQIHVIKKPAPSASVE